MIDFVTRHNEVLILRNNQPYFHFHRKDILEEHTLSLIRQINVEANKYGDSDLLPTEEDQFMDLQNFIIFMAKRSI